MSDIGSHEHPEYRAEQAFLRILRQPGIGLDHHARAFLGLTLALRYEAEPDAPFLATARLLLSDEATRRATILGVAMRLAYTLSAGTPDLLAGTGLRGKPCADAAPGRGQRRVRRRERDTAAGTAGPGDGAGLDDRSGDLRPPGTEVAT